MSFKRFIAVGVLVIVIGCQSSDGDNVLKECCSGLGTCLLNSMVPEESTAFLGRDSCDSKSLCLPTEFIDFEGYVPTTCRSTLDSEGRCLPECLPDMDIGSEMLPKSDCLDNYLCAPCHDLFTGDPTGSCELGGDPGPSEPAIVFDTCCMDKGRCIPGNLVPLEYRPRLSEADCSSGENLLCTPNEFFEEGFLLASCRSTLNAEGRCVPICLPEVADQQDDLPGDICAEYSRCAPCFDLRTGESTGICELGGDPGPALEPVLFDSCCNGLGSCIPSELVPEDQRQYLDSDTCPKDQGLLCAPKDFMEDNFIPATCNSTLDAEGRCVPECLPEVVEIKDLLPKDSCSEKHLCAPCYEPFEGEATGLCELGSDPGPSEPAVIFDTCCTGKGRCVPKDLVPVEHLSHLDENTCSAGEDLICMPDVFFEDDFLLSTCRSTLKSEGRCVPICLPEVAEQKDDLPGDICADHFRCAPCFDLRTGESTGLCELGGDPGPDLEPVLFESCCDDLGSCIPTELIPEDQSQYFSSNTCPNNQGLLCVPNDFMEDDYIPPTCSSTLEAEGRCVPECLPDVNDIKDLIPKDICSKKHLCAPCYDPFSGDETGLCGLGNDPGPTEPTVVFDSCCDGLGRCIPENLIPSEQRGKLGEDTCTANQSLKCTPSFLLEDKSIPATCYSILGAEGRCLPACLPDVAEQAEWLPRDICLSDYLCTPCYDPFTGALSGACGFPDDPGPTRPPKTFENCCDELGTCLPSDLVPDEQQALLGKETCPNDEGLLCVPEVFQEDGFVPFTCSSIAGVEGRCMPDCLPDVAAQAAFLPQGGCYSGFLCTPCYDPFAGGSTGACELPEDPGPQNDPYVFTKCCDVSGIEIGTCVPSDIIPEDFVDQMQPDTCAEVDYLCAPDSIILNPSADGLPECTAGGLSAGQSGVCVPGCYLEGWQTILLPRTSCSQGEHCVPL